MMSGKEPRLLKESTKFNGFREFEVREADGKDICKDAMQPRIVWCTITRTKANKLLNDKNGVAHIQRRMP